MLKKLRSNSLKLIAISIAVIVSHSANANIQTIEVVKNNSTTITVPEKIKTMIIGNPAIAKTIVLKPDTLLINGTTFGSTSLTLFGKSGANYEYKIHVTHDLTLLRAHLKKVDPRIIVNTDLNSDAIILSGVATNFNLVHAAEEAAYRFFGEFQNSITVIEGEGSNINQLNRFQSQSYKYLKEANNYLGQINDSANDDGLGSIAEQNRSNRINAEKANIARQNAIAAALVERATNIDGSVSSTKSTPNRTLTSQVRIINLILSETALVPPAQRLQALLSEVDNRIVVEEVNGVMMLKGRVKSPAALSRALSTADRFMAGGGIPPDFSVISDQGGILAGNTDEEQTVNPVLPRPNGGNGNNNNRNNNISNNNNSVNNQTVTALTLGNSKGNLAQNIARGDVVMAANGRVMSTIKVDKNPRVEIQMRIVGVDRSKTEDLGLDWSIVNGSTSGGGSTIVSLGSFLGNNTSEVFGDTNNDGTLDVGTSTLVAGLSKITGSKTLSILSFLRWVETKGAAKTLTEPLLTALSGESATFNVGGTLPIQTQNVTTTANASTTTQTQTTITYLQYGLGIVVRPTVLENGKISIVLDQTLSEPDYTVAVPVLSADVPGFKTRTVNTITESADGETWAVAGLLNEEDTVTTKAVPFLSNIPVLGWLFRNENKGKSRKELLIVVTARIVGDEEAQPSQITENNISTEQLNQMIKQPKPQAPKQPASSSNAQSILQKQPSYTKPAKAKTPPTAESIP